MDSLVNVINIINIVLSKFTIIDFDREPEPEPKPKQELKKRDLLVKDFDEKITRLDNFNEITDSKIIVFKNFLNIQVSKNNIPKFNNCKVALFIDNNINFNFKWITKVILPSIEYAIVCGPVEECVLDRFRIILCKDHCKDHDKNREYISHDDILYLLRN